MHATELAELQNGLTTAFVDASAASNLAYRPAFLSNDYRNGKKVLSDLEEELLHCDRFMISVAFITMSGVTPLLQTFKELEKRGVPGYILTTNYLCFSEPEALEKLHGLRNLTIKMFDVDAADEGFHTKGYIFEKGEIYRIIIGSSNMTSAALTTNREWNTRIVTTRKGEVANRVMEEMRALWASKHALPYDAFIDRYREQYEVIKRQREIARQEEIVSLERYRLKPNSMQLGVIRNLRNIVAAGERRALLISATGTGKTYAAAFAMRELGFKRVLFVVHRNQICKQAKRSFENVFGSQIKTGLVSGLSHDYDADFVFATVQTLSKRGEPGAVPEGLFRRLRVR